MTKIIEVTEEDIANGKRNSLDACPIALALRRKFPSSEINVGYATIVIDGQVYYTTDEIFDFLFNFQNAGDLDLQAVGEIEEVKPFSFDLDSLEKCKVNWLEIRRKWAAGEL